MISTVDHRQTPLLDQVLTLAQSPQRRFYMPGHKGGRGASSRLIQLLGHGSLRADMPELPTLDQLFAPSGVIQEAQSLAAHAFGAEQTYFLVNGTSVGLMAAVMTLCEPGEKIIVPRNCHQSIIHGLILSGACPVWIYPEFDPTAYLPYCLTPQQLQVALEQCPDAKAAIAISPTYEGVCGDIQSLAAIAHQHHVPLIVDEAHGAHLSFHPELPPSALSQGADLVVQSTHKMLGALTQASMLHVQGDRVNRAKLLRTLTLLQSSSPNYLLLASLDATRHQMAIHGQAIFAEVLEQAANLRRQLNGLSKMSVLELSRDQSQGFTAIDPLKLTLTLSNFSGSGFELDDMLSRTYRIWAELPADNAITFLLGPGNSWDELDQLGQALIKLEQQYERASSNPPIIDPSNVPTIPALTPRQAFDAPSKPVNLDQALGKLSAALICPYPPGIPLIFPGEKITEDAIATLTRIQSLGGYIVGLLGETHNLLEILDLSDPLVNSSAIKQ